MGSELFLKSAACILGNRRRATELQANSALLQIQKVLDRIPYIPYDTNMEPEKLHEWRSSLEADVLKLKDEIQSLNSQLQKKNQQIELISRLIDSAVGSSPRALETVPDVSTGLPTSQMVTPGQVKDHVYEILAETKRPMNINEIHSEFLRRGYRIPGKGTSFNILVHIGRELKLGRSARFYRAGRGTYSLRHNSPEKNH